MVSVGKLLTEYIWSPQHFKYISFLNRNIGEQSPANSQAAAAYSQAPASLPPSLRCCGVVSSFHWRGFSSHGWGPFASPVQAQSRPGHVISFIPFNSFPGFGGGEGRSQFEKKKTKQNRIPKNLPLTHLLTFSKSLNFFQPCFPHLWIGDSHTRHVVSVSYVSESRDGVLGDGLWTLWFSLFTNFIAYVDIFPSKKVDTLPLKCSNSDWLSRQEEQVHVPMSGMTHLIGLLENIECVVVFTLTNAERLILLLFFTVTFPDLYLEC